MVHSGEHRARNVTSGWGGERRAEAGFRSARAAHGRSGERSAAWTGTTCRNVPRAARRGTKTRSPRRADVTGGWRGEGLGRADFVTPGAPAGVHVTLLGPRPTFVTCAPLTRIR